MTISSEGEAKFSTNTFIYIIWVNKSNTASAFDNDSFKMMSDGYIPITPYTFIEYCDKSND